VEAVSITLEELEAVRLVDLLDLDQQEAAFYMGISRKAFWNDLMNARKKIAAALVYGMGLRIEGGSFALRGEEASMAVESQEHQKEMTLMEREIALLGSRLEYLSSKLEALKGEKVAETNRKAQAQAESDSALLERD
jgi:predicted DNA-binding protein (UPF0251 family)